MITTRHSGPTNVLSIWTHDPTLAFCWGVLNGRLHFRFSCFVLLWFSLVSDFTKLFILILSGLLLFCCCFPHFYYIITEKWKFIQLRSVWIWVCTTKCTSLSTASLLLNIGSLCLFMEAAYDLLSANFKYIIFLYIAFKKFFKYLDIMLNEISLTQKYRHGMMSLICGTKVKLTEPEIKWICLSGANRFGKEHSGFCGFVFDIILS